MQPDNDVLIVGGGLAGCIAAARLIQYGIRVQVIDRLAEPLDEFRAEQIVGLQPEKLRKLGLLAPLARHARPSRVTGNYRRGALLDHTPVEQYGLPYQAMVRAVRSVLPPGCLIAARVKSVETSVSMQRVHLASGQTMTARLIVLATGLMPHLAKELGITWNMKSEAHSLCLGFGIELADPCHAAKIPLTYYRENVHHRIDYITLFRMGDIIRANLFCYNRREDDWTRDFIDHPDETLSAAMPGLSRIIGPSTIVAPVEVRKNDIKIATNVEQDGVVLIGDAFQTPCPATGTGIDRILSDVEALERLVPSWLATEGLSAGKVAQYYRDPAKRAFDAECLRISRYRRDVSTKADARWALHRARVDLQRRLKALMPLSDLPVLAKPTPAEAMDR